MILLFIRVRKFLQVEQEKILLSIFKVHDSYGRHFQNPMPRKYRENQSWSSSKLLIRHGNKELTDVGGSNRTIKPLYFSTSLTPQKQQQSRPRPPPKWQQPSSTFSSRLLSLLLPLSEHPTVYQTHRQINPQIIQYIPKNIEMLIVVKYIQAHAY